MKELWNNAGSVHTHKILNSTFVIRRNDNVNPSFSLKEDLFAFDAQKNGIQEEVCKRLKCQG